MYAPLSGQAVSPLVHVAKTRTEGLDAAPGLPLVSSGHDRGACAAILCWVSRLPPAKRKPARFRFAWNDARHGNGVPEGVPVEGKGRTMPTISQLIRKPREPKVY